MPTPQRNVRSGFYPGLNNRTFSQVPHSLAAGEPMTLQGTINKSFLMLIVLMAAALYPWSQYLSSGNPAVLTLPMWGGLLGGFGLAIWISLRPTMAPYLSLPYAALEGLAVGAISAMFEKRFPGIAIQAVGLTFAVLAVMLLLYTSRIIRVTQRMVSVVVGATGAIMLLYLVTMGLGFFHISVPFMTSSSPLSIGISLLIVGVAAFNLMLDFNLIESGVAQGAPRYMEWYAGFGLLVTLVWLYLEILRLLSKINQR